MKITASAIYFISLLASSSATTYYDFDCGVYGGGSISIGPGGMDFSVSLDNLLTDVVQAPSDQLGYHLHTIWNNAVDYSISQCGPDQTGLHYDPTFACGPASEAISLPVCTGADYSGCAVDPAACEIGDLSGKYGNLVVAPDGKAAKSVTGDPSAASPDHFVLDNLMKSPGLWSSIVFHDISGARVLCCKIEQQQGGGAFDDPHFKTWSGKWYDFMGACDLHLLKAPYFDADMDLVIDIRTKIRYNYSYIESAVVKIGQETLEVSSFGQYVLNGVADAALPGTLSGFAVTHRQPSEKVHEFEIQITEDEMITLRTFKDMVSVKVDNAEKSRFHDSVGMMGAFETGIMLARDGQTVIEDPNEFAAEWQVQGDEPMLFNTVQGPQYPQKCELPSASMLAEKSRRLAESPVSLEAAQMACAHWPEDSREACVFDCMATGDLDLASAGGF